jgi:hypothetical protein
MEADIAAYRAQFNQAYNDVTRLYLLRHVWRNLQAMLASRPDMHHDPLVYNWMNTCYAETIGVGIRRQAQVPDSKPNRARATIGSLLRRVEENAASFTRVSCGFDRPQLPGRPDQWLNFAPTVDGHLNPARVAPIRVNLAEAEATTRHWINRKIAHLDPRGYEDVTFGDLERGLAGLHDGLMFLYPLFNPGSVLMQITPLAGYGMFEMFKEPWYVDGAMRPVDESDEPMWP